MTAPHAPPTRPGRLRASAAPSPAEWLYLALGLVLVWRYAWMFDDSFVYFRYVDNALFLGTGLVYNAGEFVEGYSSPLHLGALLLLRLFELGWPAIVLGLGLGAFAAFWWSAIAVHRALSPEDTSRLNVPLGLVAASYSATSFFTAGNEGPWLHLFAALTALAILRPALRVPTVAVALLPLVRIELGVALVAVVLLRRFVQRRPVAPLVLWAVALNGAWLLFRIRTYADLFPNTFHLKALTEIEGTSPAAAGLAYLWEALAPYGTALVLVAGLALAAVRQDRVNERAMLIVVAAATATPVVLSGGSSMHYYYLAFPITLALLALGGVVDLVGAVRGRVAIVLLLVGWTLARYPATLDRHPSSGAELQVVLPSETVVTDPSFFRRRPALPEPSAEPWPAPDDMRAFRDELARDGYREWTDSLWCNAIYAHFRVRSVHPYGLTDALLARVETPEIKRGHKPALAALALDLIEIQRSTAARGLPIGPGVYTRALEDGSAPDWMRANARAVGVIERKAFNSHDLVENLALALRRPVRLSLPPPR